MAATKDLHADLSEPAAKSATEEAAEAVTAAAACDAEIDLGAAADIRGVRYIDDVVLVGARYMQASFDVAGVRDGVVAVAQSDVDAAADDAAADEGPEEVPEEADPGADDSARSPSGLMTS